MNPRDAGEPRRLAAAGSLRARTLLRAAKHDLPQSNLETDVLGALSLVAVGAVAPSFGARLLVALKHAVASKLSVSIIVVTAAGAGYVAGRLQERTLSAEAVITPRPLPSVSAVVSTAARPPRGVFATVSPPVTATPVDSQPLRALQASETKPPIADKSATVRTTSRTQALAVESDVARPSVQVREASTDVVDAPMTTAPPTPPSLAAELEAIRKVRASVLAGDGKAALAELDTYDGSHPHGTFEEEALALRVRAQRMLGDAAAASRTLADLETRFPHSVHTGALKEPSGK